MNLKIEKMIYGGDGLSRLPADASGRRQAVFIPFVLPAEEVDVTLTGQKPGFARARLNKVLSSSPQRGEPACPYFSRCGGCHYQHTGYENQLAIKEAILRETLLRTAKLDWKTGIVIHSAEPWGYRNRTRFHVHGAVPSSFAAGFYQPGSHKLLPVEQCPVSSPLINRGLSAIWMLGRERKVPACIRELEFFANAADTRMLLELYASSKLGTESKHLLANFCTELSSLLPELAGAAVFVNEPGKPVVDKPVWSFAETAIHYQAAGHGFRVQSGSFFQVNRYLVDKMVNIVTAGQSGQYALDLYAGTGLFSLPLANSFARVTAVESSPLSFGDLLRNVPANVEVECQSTEDFLLHPPKDIKPELVVADPPRAGLGEKVVRALRDLKSQRLVYVSCDPATLSRDLRGLIESGYHVDAIHLVDLFPQTFHLETVVQMSR